MTTEKEARAIARHFPIEAHAGWLLACSSPANLDKGNRMIDRMDMQDRARATQYRDYCIAVYSAGQAA